MTNADTAMCFWQPNNYKKRLSCDRCYIELRSALPGRDVEETDPRAKAACKRVTGPLPDGAAPEAVALRLLRRAEAEGHEGAAARRADICASTGSGEMCGDNVVDPKALEELREAACSPARQQATETAASSSCAVEPAEALT